MIILSSFGLESPIIKKQYKRYIEAQDKNILILPFAGLNDDATAQYEQQMLLDYGFDKKSIFLCDESNVDAIRNIEFDYIYVPGGDTFKLLNTMKKLNLLAYIKDSVSKGTSYIGVSAGAYVTSECIEYVKNIENDELCLNDYCGLGIVRENILCHVDQLDYGTIMTCKRKNPQKDYIYIRNDEVVIL